MIELRDLKIINKYKEDFVMKLNNEFIGATLKHFLETNKEACKKLETLKTSKLDKDVTFTFNLSDEVSIDIRYRKEHENLNICIGPKGQLINIAKVSDVTCQDIKEILFWINPEKSILQQRKLAYNNTNVISFAGYLSKKGYKVSEKSDKYFIRL